MARFKDDELDEDPGSQRDSFRADQGERELPPVEIPHGSLSADAIAGVIDDFILREGTDYGNAEVLLETKRDQVRKQLQSGSVKIVFDPNTESVTLMTERDWRKLAGSGVLG